ncbi:MULTISPECIES: hypothetical protein [unclassified Nostoc]|uniref:hypothetical protein n=1 Tax=unclassified Nostoc TaxID=2593658 RepID=UPI002AD565CC|nr:hypothetical protein [Nostoc sp. DedQUE03]MDZ7972492.1 hypothetical protein [Nostoc sp. DedQUE03]MDZ8044692.1 hypothetical protein [Nostoc sp. DedQUE02]
MELLQQQILTLSQKLDDLCQVIEQLDGKVAQAFSECSLANTQAKDNHQGNGTAGGYQFKGRISLNPEMEHKDVLTDGVYLDMHRQSGDNITPEIQIQRLTAQLTAAYNRIAALEEQLLRERIH